MTKHFLIIAIAIIFFAALVQDADAGDAAETATCCCNSGGGDDLSVLTGLITALLALVLCLVLGLLCGPCGLLGCLDGGADGGDLLGGLLGTDSTGLLGGLLKNNGLIGTVLNLLGVTTTPGDGEDGIGNIDGGLGGLLDGVTL